MINEAVFHGLIAALSRGESLQSAMLSFYYAGYGKKEIEEAARELHKQTGGQAEKMINPQKISDENKLPSSQGAKQKEKLAPKAKVPPLSFQQSAQDKGKVLSKEELKKQEKDLKKHPDKEKFTPVQIVSKYGERDGEVGELKAKLEKALSEFKNIKLPSEFKIVHQESEQRQPIIVQEISGYGEPPKPINKAVTLLLIFLLIILLGALAAVFVFKEQLIDIFNKFNIN